MINFSDFHLVGSQGRSGQIGFVNGSGRPHSRQSGVNGMQVQTSKFKGC